MLLTKYQKNHNSDREQKLLLTKYQKNHNSDGEQKLLLTKYRWIMMIVRVIRHNINGEKKVTSKSIYIYKYTSIYSILSLFFSFLLSFYRSVSPLSKS